jgi:N-acetylmuramic acid 6-phosphate etherase
MAATETISARYRGLDTWPDEAILDAFSEGQEKAVAAVRAAHPAIAAAARAIAAQSGERGRLIYVGAGSSGLIAALDGIELGGTFGWPDDRVVFLLANGTTLTPGLAGGPEDDATSGRSAMMALLPNRDDTVIAVAASGTTPFTLAAVEAARGAGALTVGIANNRGAPLLAAVGAPIFLDSGAEVIVGSTRMNAGTAQKAALNMLSTLTMIRLGHIHDGHMVSVRVENAKLRKRALATIMNIAGCGESDAMRALERAGSRIKPAVLVALGYAPAEAERLLAAAGGHLRTALAKVNERERVTD